MNSEEAAKYETVGPYVARVNLPRWGVVVAQHALPTAPSPGGVSFMTRPIRWWHPADLWLFVTDRRKSKWAWNKKENDRG